MWLTLHGSLEASQRCVKPYCVFARTGLSDVSQPSNSAALEHDLLVTRVSRLLL